MYTLKKPLSKIERKLGEIERCNKSNSTSRLIRINALRIGKVRFCVLLQKKKTNNLLIVRISN